MSTKNNNITTFRRLMDNDPTLEEMRIAQTYPSNVNDDNIAYISPRGQTGWKMAGEHIGNNNTCQKLVICWLDAKYVEVFMNGVKRNNNIDGLIFVNWDVLHGAVFPHMKLWLENNNQLIMLQLVRCPIGHEGIHLLASALTGGTSLEHIAIRNCSIDDDHDTSIEELVSVLSLNRTLCRLDLSQNNIGTRGSYALTSMLSNPTCELKTLNLSHNDIGDEGIMYLAQGLAKNDKLAVLDITNVFSITSKGWDYLTTTLCNTKTINDIFLSNHRLNDLGLERRMLERMNSNLALYTSLNRANDSFVPAQKIIMHHRDTWDMFPYIEEELTFLPHILKWLDRAGILNTNFRGINNSKKRQNRRSLQSMRIMTLYQFVHSFPVVVVEKLQKAQLLEPNK